jgi:tetratricopeptide (TPR) repeat protein
VTRKKTVALKRVIGKNSVIKKRISLAFAAALIALATAGCGKKMSSDDYVKNAQRFYGQQDYEKARVEYRNALAVDAENAQAHSGLAAIAKYKEDYAAQFFHLQKTVELNAKDATSHFELGELALLLGDLEVAKKSEKALATLAPASASYYQLALAIAIAEKNWLATQQLSTEALTAFATNAELWGLKGVAAKKQSQWPEAIAALDQAIEFAGTQSAQYRLLRIEVNEARGDVAASIDDLTALIATSTNPEAQIIRLTQLINQYQGQAKAIATLESFIAKYPEAYALQTLHVDLIKQADPARAGQLLDDYIGAAKNPVGLLFYRAYAALSNNYIALAEQDLQKILTRVNSEVSGQGNSAADHPTEGNIGDNKKAQTEANALLAELAWLKGDIETARSTVKTVLAINPNHARTLLLQAKIALQDKRGDDAVASLNKVLNQDAKNIEALALLAAYYQQQGKSSIASDFYDRILLLDSHHYGALQFKITESFNKGFLTNTDALLAKALEQYPQDATLLSIKVQVSALRGHFDEAETLVKKLELLEVNRADILFFKGYIRQQKNDHPAAIGYFKQAISARGRFEKALNAMYQSAQKTQAVAAFTTYLGEQVKADADDLSAQLLLAQLRATTSPREAIDQLENVRVKFPQWHAGTLLLANILVQQQRADDALALLKTSYQTANDIAVGIAYARQLEQQTLILDAVAIYDDLLLRDSGNAIVRNNYALLLAAKGEPADVRKALQLSEGFASTDNPALLDTYGAVLMQADKATDAIYIFKKALDLADLPDIHLHYADALQQVGKAEQAQAALQRLRNKIGDDAAVNAQIEALQKRWEKTD